MANTLHIWDKTTPLTNQRGESITHAEAARRYGAAALANKPVIECTPSGIMVAIDDLDILCDIYHIDDGLTDEQKLAAIVQTRKANAAGATLTTDEVMGILTGEVE